jgi:hypothetical protein
VRLIGGNERLPLHKVIELEVWQIPIHLRPRLPQVNRSSRQGLGSTLLPLPPCLRISHNEMAPQVGHRIRVVEVPVLEAGDRMLSVLMGSTVSLSFENAIID